MSRAIANALDERWAAYLRLYGKKAIYSAFVRLSEIANCLQHGQIPLGLASKWSAALNEVTISPDAVQSIRCEARNKIERLQRIVGSSGILAYEEILFVITLRTELDMLLSYLEDRGIEDLPDASSLDDDVLAIARSLGSSSAYRSAQESARRNWGLPLRSKWLDGDTMP